MKDNTKLEHGGVKIYAVHKDGKPRHIGTCKGSTYEKGLSIAGLIHRPVLSASLGQDELRQVRQAGAEFFRIVRRDTSETHAIELSKFLKYAKLEDRGYGLQYICPLHHFETVHWTRPRNPITDNPVQERPSQLPLWEQSSIFQSEAYR